MIGGKQVGWALGVVFAAVIGVWSGPGFAQSSIDPNDLVHGDPTSRPGASDRLFLQLLKKAVENDERAWIAEQVSYPIRVAVRGKWRSLRNSQEFLGDYGDIVNARMRDAILKQRFEDLFRNWQGTMISRGLVWFDGVYVADGCQQGTWQSPDRCVFMCDHDQTYRVMILTINNDFNPETGTHDPFE